MIFFEGKRTDIPLWVGGISNNVYLLSKYLIKQGHEVSVLTHPFIPNKLLEPLDGKLYYAGFGILSKFRKIFNFFKQDFDVIHIHQLHTPILVNLIKIIKRITKSRAKIIYSIYSHADKTSKSIGFADKVLFSCKYNHNKIKFLPENKKEIISLSPMDSFFKLYPKNKNPKNFLCNYAHEKEFDTSNFDFFKELKSRVPDFKLYWPERNPQKQKSVWDSLREAFRSNIIHMKITNMPVLMEKAAFYVYIVSSKEARTCPPLTVLEAMASGAVVICRKSPVLEDLIVHKKTGLIFENKTSEIMPLVTNEPLIKKIRKAAFEASKKFERNKVYSSYLGVYKRLKHVA